MIGVSPDSPEALQKFRAKLNLPFVLLSDTDHEVLEKYGVWQQKKLYGRTFMGVVRGHYVIDETGRIIDVQFKVSPADSPVKAIAALIRSD